MSKAIIIIFVAIAFYAGILIYSDFTNFDLSLIQINWYYLPPILLISFSLMILAGVRYHIILKDLQIDIALKDSIYISLIGQSMLVTPGRVGNYIKCLILKNRYDVPISTSAPSVIGEQILELISASIFVLILSFWIDFLETRIIALIGFSLIFFFLGFVYNSHIFILTKKILHKIKYFKKFIEPLDNSRDHLKTLFSFNSLRKTFSLSIVIKLIQIFLIFLIFGFLNINLDYFMSGIVYNTSLLYGAISFIPGGLIVTDASMLSLIIKNGIDFSLASISVIIIRLFTLWISVFVGFLSIKFSKISISEN